MPLNLSPPFGLLQTAQQTWSQARSDLEAFEARGAVGRPDQRNPDITASFQRGVAELQQRVAAADGEVKRISTLQRQANARRNALRQVVDQVREWARQNSIVLPGDDDAVRVPGFAASSVHIATPSPTARTWP